jgi:hypothetical protein
LRPGQHRGSVGSSGTLEAIVIAANPQAADGLSGHGASALLNYMTQLMGEQPPSLRRLGLVGPWSEDDVAACGVGDRVQAAGRSLRIGPAMDAHVAEILPEA